ncbi:MAG: phospholipase A [Rhizobacter sp.]|nr:phospholipase A [Rhizobacter sp.]
MAGVFCPHAARTLPAPCLHAVRPSSKFNEADRALMKARRRGLEGWCSTPTTSRSACTGSWRAEAGSANAGAGALFRCSCGKPAHRSNSRGSAGLDRAFPITGNLKGQVQLFCGYGESLNDYRFRQTRVGWAFRWWSVVDGF